MSAFNFDNPDPQEELKRWLLERLPQLVTLSDHIWRILGDSNNMSSEEKNAKLVDMATAFVKSGGSCFEGFKLNDDQISKFQQLIPGLVALASMTVKGPLVPNQCTEDALLNKDEAAAYLKISKRKLEREVEKRNIVRIKLGRGQTAKVQFKKSDLDAYLAKNTIPVGKHVRQDK